MRVLVTGGSGKFGTFVVKELMPDSGVLERILAAEFRGSNTSNDEVNSR